ncbi:hypothetical protein FQR65_LT02250 [Abscondita terminalis]|nr:hypothetical protein FQR65_LT02250 [Abscondita terminalis]
MTNRTRDTMVCYGPTGGAAGEWSGVGRGEVEEKSLILSARPERGQTLTTMTNRTRDTMVCYGPTGGAAGEWSGVGRGEVGGEVAHR